MPERPDAKEAMQLDGKPLEKCPVPLTNFLLKGHLPLNRDLAE